MNSDTKDRVKQYLDHHYYLLSLMKQMWEDPRVQFYNDNEMPSKGELKDGSVFMAGPTSRTFILEFNWRCLGVKYLRDAGYKGWIYIPEPRGVEEEGDFTERRYIHSWESSRLFSAIHKVFWIPRKGVELLGLNTNLELGIILGMALSQKPLSTFIGWPPGAERMGLPNHYASQLAGYQIYQNLELLCSSVTAHNANL